MLKVPSLPCTLSQTFFPTCFFFGCNSAVCAKDLRDGCDLHPAPHDVNFILCIDSATSFTVVSRRIVKSRQALKRLLKLGRTRFARYLPINKVKTIQGQSLVKLSFRKGTLANIFLVSTSSEKQNFKS